MPATTGQKGTVEGTTGVLKKRVVSGSKRGKSKLSECVNADELREADNKKEFTETKSSKGWIAISVSGFLVLTLGAITFFLNPFSEKLYSAPSIPQASTSPYSSPISSSTSQETTDSTFAFNTPASIGFSKKVPLAALGPESEHLGFPSAGDGVCQTYQYGEDATFVTNWAIGVADGVGGWVGKPGADPAYVSKELMGNTCREFSSSLKTQNAVESLYKAYTTVLTQMSIKGILGSTTATVARIAGSDLDVAHVGDSALFVIRDGKVIYKTKEQTFMFNGPLQLGTRSNVNVLKDAESKRLEIMEGDIVVAASDGVIDNLFPEEISKIAAEHVALKPAPPNSVDLQIARAIAVAARKVSESKTVTTPFSRSALEHGYHYQGGKVDDVSVVVGVVKRVQPQGEAGKKPPFLKASL